MSYIELLDEQIVNFYRSHNYWWPDEIVMSQNTMDKLKQEVRSRGFYDWKGNKGYPTKKHREAIKIHGATPYHRRTFNLLGDTQLSLEFKEE